MISFERYGKLLRQPELRDLFAISVLGRLPIGIAGLALILLTQHATGSFARGGAVAACYLAGLALVAPLLGRLIDRLGPRSVLLPAAFVFPAALSAHIPVAQMAEWPWLPFALALATGASFPPITACMRTYFRQRYRNDELLLATAFSIESILMELIFILGPATVAIFVAVASPAAAVGFAAACGGVGTLLFLRSDALRQWHVEPRAAASLFGPLTERGFLPLLAVVLCYASAFGLVEIGVTAHATEAGRPALAGVLLGLMSVGSAAGGLVYGGRSWPMALERQFALTLAIMGLGVLPLALLPGGWPYYAWCLVAGVVMAPALIMQSILVAKIARAEHATEAFTWSATALLTGVGIGLIAGGWLVESARSGAALAAAAAVAVGAGLLALKLVRPRVRPPVRS